MIVKRWTVLDSRLVFGNWLSFSFQEQLQQLSVGEDWPRYHSRPWQKVLHHGGLTEGLWNFQDEGWMTWVDSRCKSLSIIVAEVYG